MFSKSHQLRMKSPNGFKEWIGWLTKTIGSPIVGAIITYVIMLQVEWQTTTRILFGLFIAFPWFWMISRWFLLMPIWSSLYIPTPDAPTDEGIIESNVYKNSDGSLYLRGHCFDVIRYTETHNNETLCLERMNSWEEASLEKTDTIVKLHYKFIKYRNGSVKASYYRSTPRMEYKWPVYEYEISSTKPTI